MGMGMGMVVRIVRIGNDEEQLKLTLVRSHSHYTCPNVNVFPSNLLNQRRLNPSHPPSYPSMGT